jgi:hypothetical protein
LFMLLEKRLILEASGEPVTCVFALQLFDILQITFP